MPIKSVKMKISINKKTHFFLMSQGSFNPKITFLGQKLCPVARVQTDRQTHMKMTTVGTLSGFQEFFLQPTIKDRPNENGYSNAYHFLTSGSSHSIMYRTPTFEHSMGHPWPCVLSACWRALEGHSSAVHYNIDNQNSY